ncbi:MAG: GspH/FimT family pseudopilin [Hylemonella sp.]|nr:GspH/FimT family pseudopilin [Hylemonella sp.]
MHLQALQKGYSLIELLVALSLVTTLMAWAVPTLSDVIHSVRVNTGTQALATSLALARSEAVKRNARVVMCKSAQGTACEPDAAWEQGWIVFHDLNSNGVVDAGEPVVHREAAMPPTLRMSGNTPVSHYVLYTPYGRTKQLSGAFQAGTFTVCAAAGKRVQARQVVINSVGRARVANAGLTQCV